VTNLEGLPARVDSIEQKLDALSESVDLRFAEVNARFDEVDKRFHEASEHFVERREYTEFAFERLRKEMVERFTRVESLIATNTAGLARLERRRDRFEGEFDEFLESQRKPGRRQRSRRVSKKGQ
jgi:hypothetical protein